MLGVGSQYYQASKVKSYLIEKEGLETFIVELQNHLKRMKHFDVACIIS